MTAARHITDALTELTRLDRDIDSLIGALRAGKPVGLDDLSHLRRVTLAARCQTAFADHALTHVPPADRRDRAPRIVVTPALPPTLPQLLTPAQKAVDEYHAGLDASDAMHGPLGFVPGMPEQTR